MNSVSGHCVGLGDTLGASRTNTTSAVTREGDEKAITSRTHGTSQISKQDARKFVIHEGGEDRAGRALLGHGPQTLSAVGTEVGKWARGLETQNHD